MASKWTSNERNKKLKRFSCTKSMVIEIQLKSEHFSQAVFSEYFQLKEKDTLCQRLTSLTHCHRLQGYYTYQSPYPTPSRMKALPMPPSHVPTQSQEDSHSFFPSLLQPPRVDFSFARVGVSLPPTPMTECR